MSHGKLRENKNCLNCNHQVEERFCPHCGQENIETRQPFHYLFTHFIEDFTHYDGQFWQTIKYLLIRPGKLTKEYLSGKRQTYVAPVKLYIFISFITFLVPNFFPHSESGDHKKEKTIQVDSKTKKEEQAQNTEKTLENLTKEGILSEKTAQKTKSVIDSAKKADPTDDLIDSSLSDESAPILNAHNMTEYEQLQKKDESGFYSIMKPLAKKMFEMKEKGLTKKQIWEKYGETIVHTVPKALFVYLPIFAFFLWIFHNKKKWWYFDHGIFTLHYFSFLLLAILSFIILKNIVSYLPDYGIINLLYLLAYTALIIYLSVYFFIAHHRVYEHSRTMSVFKGMALFIVNCIGLTCMFLVLLYVSLITMH
ncbi:DUF3667 domain-containing protein [Chryseobacterium sp. JUb7]|uniref:DUF3667 domain-containing protein n=1 Tax=Chryseobacterium sp. JUb7 TaxID=2940599 RepID=UPI00216A4D1C|nr:DUF3667 domain-containing protein [Chryseobacterium sp. JUb7]MCS3530726.1 hypothetical protein [Chryseobacterium sp. JUb7]